MIKRASFAVWLAVASSVWWCGSACFAAEGAIRFNRDVRPILSDNCWACHGPDASHREADLRLDLRDDALAVIEPGKPDDSELIRRIMTDDADEIMPPPDAHKKLSGAQKETLRRWVEQGAEYEGHWAYQPLVRPEVPVAGGQGPVGAEHAIDRFIAAKLRAEGVDFSPEADRATLLRRLSLDLIGLPPTPEEVAAFVADRDPNAYEKQVDRLLASPHYGERMAAPWLDVVRFADTVGYHGDQGSHIFPYRDYVIDAFNNNKPFDQFTIEQLAGDLLPNATEEQRIASAFNRLNMVTREGGAQPKEYLAKYAADRVRTVSMAWLGSTMGCCECHSHKFDPFTIEDFYQMGAFFADIREWGVYQNYPYTPNPDLKGWSNDHPFPPEMEVASPALSRRIQKLVGRMQEIAHRAVAAKASDDEFAKQYAAWQQATAAQPADSDDGWKVLACESTDGVEPQPDGSLLISKELPEHKLRLVLPAQPLAMIRLELIPHEKLQGKSLRGANAVSIAPNPQWQAADGKPKPLKVVWAGANHRLPKYFNGQELPGLPGNVWNTLGEKVSERQTLVWVLERGESPPTDAKLVLSLPTQHIGCIRVSVSPVVVANPLGPAGLVEFRDALKAKAAGGSAAGTESVDLAYLFATAFDASALQACRQWQNELHECRNGTALVMTTVSQTPRTMRVLPRGNFLDETGAEVQPAVPQFLPQPKIDGDRRLTRLDLAKWLVSPENPLTARVVINRLWKQFYGAGLSYYVEDVGAQGEPPSHPELLDWLAVEFRDSGWNVKHMVKLLVTSRTYKQVASLRPELRDRDPGNRWLASMSPRRLEAEFVRDQALFVAGLLDMEIGGPSARPYQPPGYYANLQFPDRDYLPHQDDRQYRRGVYTHWQRTFLHPMLANFDAPSREDCVGLRIVSNTPQQALTLLNDPTFVEAARVFAARLLSEPAAGDAARLNRAFELVLSRLPGDREREELLKYLQGERDYFAQLPDEAAKLTRAGIAPPAEGLPATELAAWTSVARVLLNLHETINR